ncbi:MAG: sugar ABC transporter permease [Lachnospiraceae bacterium]|nr:sugar ABC transporter permease [Lachnospiraceae bacterium]
MKKNQTNQKNKPAVSGRSNVKLSTRIWKHRDYYLMLLPALVYIILFNYVPMYGLQIAFKDYRVSLGITGSKWVGFKHFITFFNSFNFWDLLTNTLTLSLYRLLVGFPIPIFVALVINELKGRYKQTIQTILYAPHFLSIVVIAGMIRVMFSMSNGVVNHIIEALGGEPIYFMASEEWFRHLYVWSGIWQEMGWAAIIYIAALAGVDPGLHEAASIDGATRLQRVIHINIPTILPTIIITLILNVGQLISIGHEKVFLLQTELNINASEVISTYVYKKGIINTNYSFSAAVGMFNNVTNVILLIVANQISKRVTKTSLF